MILLLSPKDQLKSLHLIQNLGFDFIKFSVNGFLAQLTIAQTETTDSFRIQ